MKIVLPFYLAFNDDEGFRAYQDHNGRNQDLKPFPVLGDCRGNGCLDGGGRYRRGRGRFHSAPGFGFTCHNCLRPGLGACRWHGNTLFFGRHAEFLL
jgi:hypothetical protein